MKIKKYLLNRFVQINTNIINRGFINYTCTNHPEIILNEPGICPECGKDLVKKY